MIQLALVWLVSSIVVMPSECRAKDLTAAQILMSIHPIEPLAMEFGTGARKAYVFVDPKCPHSRDFIAMIYENEKMQNNYHYYIFLYELKRFNSHNLIGSIYTSSSPLQNTFGVMVAGKKMDELKSFSGKVQDRIDSIASVAEAIGVNKRPYLIIKKELD